MSDIRSLWPTRILYRETRDWSAHVADLMGLVVEELSRSNNFELDGSSHNVWDWEHSCVSWLRGQMTSAASEYLEGLGDVIENPDQYWGRSWANYLKSGEGPSHQILHAHHECDFTAIFYVDQGESGDVNGALSVLDPRFLANTQILNRGYRENFPPRTGWLMIMPGFVWHEVLPYAGFSPRVSIVANFQYSIANVRD